MNLFEGLLCKINLFEIEGNFCYFFSDCEPRQEKTSVLEVSDEVRHKPACTAKDGKMARGVKFWIKEVEGLY